MTLRRRIDVLVLEDDPQRYRQFKRKLIGKGQSYAITAQVAIDKLRDIDYGTIFLDHDLGGEQMVDPSGENTGSAVVRWMCAPGCPLDKSAAIIVHSLNAPAAERMVFDLERAGYPNVRHVPFTQLVAELQESPR